MPVRAPRALLSFSQQVGDAVYLGEFTQAVEQLLHEVVVACLDLLQLVVHVSWHRRRQRADRRPGRIHGVPERIGGALRQQAPRLLDPLLDVIELLQIVVALHACGARSTGALRFFALDALPPFRLLLAPAARDRYCCPWLRPCDYSSSRWPPFDC